MLDASVALSRFMPGEQNPHTHALLTRTRNAGALVPAFWRLEVANIVLMAERKGRITHALRSRALTALARLPIRIDTETAAQAWTQTLDLAQVQNLTLYAAAYLELSLLSGGPLATLDQALRQAAISCGVTVLGM